MGFNSAFKGLILLAVFVEVYFRLRLFTLWSYRRNYTYLIITEWCSRAVFLHCLAHLKALDFTMFH